MRKWAWLGAGVALLVVWAMLAQPDMRFQAAPEVVPEGANGGAQPDLGAIRALGDELDDVELSRVEMTPGGVVEIDANYTGNEPPREQEDWNLMAKQIANHLARSPANIQTIRVFLYHENALRAQGVTTRFE